ncbi:MAG: hypothetical protein JWP60_1230 [Ramlibacter sp.]|nr:hypothetical protein [Ramlibacter sp.]
MKAANGAAGDTRTHRRTRFCSSSEGKQGENGNEKNNTPE